MTSSTTSIAGPGTPDPTAPSGSFSLKENSVGAFGLLAQSVGTSSPEIAASVTSISAVLLAGAAGPASFLLGGIAVGCLAVVLAYLSRRIVTAGGLAGLVEATLGPRAALVTGWASLVGIGFVTGIVILLGGGFAGIFFSFVLPHVSWLSSSWAPWSALIGVLVVGLSIAGVRPSVAVLFAVSLVGIGCLTILSITILAKGGAHGVAWGTLVPGNTAGVSPDKMLLAIGIVVIGFQGFESATNLGVEARRPKRQIPVVLVSVVALVWVFLMLVSLALVSGFGTSHSGITTLTTFSALDWTLLSTTYLTTWFGHMVMGLLAISCFAGALGLFNEMSRVFWSLSNEGLLPKVLSRTTRRTGAPWVAVLVLAAVAAAELVASGLWKGTKPLDITTPATWLGLVVAPGLLVAYILAAIGGAWMAHRHKAPFVIRVLCPLVVVAIFGISLYHQFVPLQPSPDTAAPFVGLGLTVIGGVVAFFAVRSDRGAGAATAGGSDEATSPPLPGAGSAGDVALEGRPGGG